MEALQSGVSVFVSADLSSIYGLYDLSVFSHGLLASHHNLLLHPHLTTGNTQVDRSSHTHTRILIQYIKNISCFSHLSIYTL